MILAAQGICFAVPINTAGCSCLALLRDGRAFGAPASGLAGQDAPLPRRLARFYGPPRPTAC